MVHTPHACPPRPYSEPDSYTTSTPKHTYTPSPGFE
jgi:hypothetical protein